MRIYISSGDGPGYNEEGLTWSDVYVKRTILSESIPLSFAEKIIPAGPHHGVRTWNAWETMAHSIRTFIAARGNVYGLRNHFWGYAKQYWQRLPLSEYVPGKTRENYVFYAATLYPTHPQYNRYRTRFIDACIATEGVTFEGGLIRKDDYRFGESRHITIERYYSPREWLEKTKQSTVGFWAPGDQGAMTLKMAEYMACGKAIIAVPIRQEQLPSPLVHGEHVHFVDGSYESIKEAVELLTKDHTYRQKLERNARRYYDEWVAPEKAVRRFIEEACKRKGIPVEEVLTQ